MQEEIRIVHCTSNSCQRSWPLEGIFESEIIFVYLLIEWVKSKSLLDIVVKGTPVKGALLYEACTHKCLVVPHPKAQGACLLFLRNLFVVFDGLVKI